MTICPKFTWFQCGLLLYIQPKLSPQRTRPTFSPIAEVTPAHKPLPPAGMASNVTDLAAKLDQDIKDCENEKKSPEEAQNVVDQLDQVKSDYRAVVLNKLADTKNRF